GRGIDRIIRRWYFRSAQAFQDHRHAVTAAATDGLQAELLVVEPQRVDQRGRDPRAGHAERVADRDRAAVHVQLVQWNVQFLVGRDDLRGERLVDLHQVDVTDTHAGPGQRLPAGLHRTE